MPKKLLTVFFIVLPIGVYFGYLGYFSVNLPNTDDLPTVFNFINTFYPFKLDKLAALFVPFREHVVVLSKLSGYGQVLLAGTLNLKTLILLGNLFWVGVAYRLYVIFKQTKLQLVYFLPVTLILFQFQFAEISFWSMAIWSNIAVLWLLVESINALLTDNKSTFRYLSALLFAILAVFTNGNGMLVLPIGLVVLLFKKEPFKKTAGWFLASAIAVYLYWQCRQSINSGYGIANDATVILLGVFAFAGSYADVVSGSFRWLAVGLGLLIVAGSVVVGFKNYAKTIFLPFNLFKLLAILSFILATAAATTLFRTRFDGLDALFLGRYRHYSALAFAVFYLVLLTGINWQKKYLNALFFAFTAFALVASALSYYRDWGYRYFQRQELTADAYNARFNNRLYLHLQNPPPLEVEFQRAARAGLFEGERYKILQKPFALPADTTAGAIQIDWKMNTNQSATLCNRVIGVQTDDLTYQLGADFQSFWVLSNGKNAYLFPATAVKASPKAFVLNGTYFKKGLKGEIPLCQIAKQGQYRLYLLNTNTKTGQRLYSGKGFRLYFERAKAAVRG